MSAPIVVIVNPVAGGGRARRLWPGWQHRLAAAGLAHSVTFTTKPDEATDLARQAVQRGAQLVVAVGGDGTANEVVNGFFDGDDLISPAARFGMIPLGTGVDLARALGLKGEAIIQALGGRGRTRSIDVGQVDFAAYDGRPERRYFVNAGDLGIGAETAALAQRGPKQLGGFAAYLVAATRAILRHRPYQVRYAIDGGSPIEGQIDTIFVTNGPCVAGGMRVAPGASVADGLLDVLILRSVDKLTLLLRLLPGIYRGTHVRHPAVQQLRARQIEVDSPGCLPLQIDGEQPGLAPARFTIRPAILPVALPPEPVA